MGRTATGVRRSAFEVRRIFAIDPGDGVSGAVEISLQEEGVPVILRSWNEIPNEELLEIVRAADHHRAILVCETFQPRGQPLYWQLVWTAIWIGRFWEAWGGRHDFLHREAVKHQICGATAVKDGNVRAALIDRWGGKRAAIGTVKSGLGPLHGLAKHAWPALGLAVAYSEGRRSDVPTTEVQPRRRQAGAEPPVPPSGAPDPRSAPPGGEVRRVRRTRPRPAPR